MMLLWIQIERKAKEGEGPYLMGDSALVCLNRDIWSINGHETVYFTQRRTSF